jgi:hypothetical protein
MRMLSTMAGPQPLCYLAIDGTEAQDSPERQRSASTEQMPDTLPIANRPDAAPPKKP